MGRTALSRGRRLSFVPLSAVTAGLVSVLVGVTSSVAIVFQAANAAGATPQQLGSWILALGVGLGVTTIALSLRYRTPVVIAWSTPGAALLAGSLAGTSMAVAVGAFLFSAVLIILSGVTGWFERIMRRVPLSLGAALLAGVLLRFGINLFSGIQADAAIVLPMIAVYLVGRRWLPRYAIVLALLTGVAVAAGTGQLHLSGVSVSVARPVFVLPHFTWQALVGIGIPLFVVTMCSQNIPGTAAIRAAGYDTPISPLITTTGVATLLLAPFGAFAINLAAITAAICMSEEAHPDPRRRYLASVSGGVFYLVVGVFGATLAGLLAAFPSALVLGIAGLGLLGTIGSSVLVMVQDEPRREASVVTFLFAASGVTLLGIGAPFWALIAGVVTMLVLRRPTRPAAPPELPPGNATTPVPRAGSSARHDRETDDDPQARAESVTG